MQQLISDRIKRKSGEGLKMTTPRSGRDQSKSTTPRALWLSPSTTTEWKGLRKNALRKRLMMELNSPSGLRARPRSLRSSSFLRSPGNLAAAHSEVQQCEAAFRTCDMEAHRIKLELAETLLTIQRLEAEIEQSNAESVDAHNRAFEAAKIHSKAAAAAERVRRIAVEGAEKHTRLRMYRQTVKGKWSPREEDASRPNLKTGESSSDSEEISLLSPSPRRVGRANGVHDGSNAKPDRWTESFVATAAKGDTDVILIMLKTNGHLPGNTSLKSLSSLVSASFDSDNGIQRSISVPASLSTSVPRQKAARLSVPSSFGDDVGKVLRPESMPSVGMMGSVGTFAGALDYPVDEPDSQGRTALYAAAYGNHFRMLQLLLMLGADPNRPSVAIGGNSPRRFLSWRSQSTVGSGGRQSTVLHAAVMRGNVRAVQLLVAHGAHLSATDAFGMSVWESIVLNLPSLVMSKKIRWNEERSTELGFRLMAMMRPFTTPPPPPTSPAHAEPSGPVPRDLVLELLLAPTRESKLSSKPPNRMPVGFERACCSAYVPSTAAGKDGPKTEGPCTRALLWRLLLRYLPWDPSQWDACLAQARMHYCELAQRFDADNSKVSMEGCRTSLTRTQRSAMQRVLGIWAMQHPDFREAVCDIQGIACVIFEVLYQEIAASHGGCGAEYQCMTVMEVEADTYGCLRHLLAALTPLMIKSDQSTSRGRDLGALESTFLRILATVDKKLHAHFLSAGVDVSVLCREWVLSLCAEDVALSSVVHYWDLFLAGLSRGSAFTLAETPLVSQDFDLVLCFCVALAHSVRALLFKAEARAMTSVLRCAPQLLNFCMKEMLSETCRVYSLCLRKGVLVFPANTATPKRSREKPSLSAVKVFGESQIISVHRPPADTVTIDTIRREMPRLARIGNWRLAYALGTHGSNFVTFQQCASRCTGPCVLLIETCDGGKIGAYTSEPLVRGWSGDKEGFIFGCSGGHCTVYASTSANSRFVYVGSPDSPESGGVGFGSDPDFALYVDHELERGSSGESATYGNPPLTDPEDFELMKMELWAIEL